MLSGSTSAAPLADETSTFSLFLPQGGNLDADGTPLSVAVDGLSVPLGVSLGPRDAAGLLSHSDGGDAQLPSVLSVGVTNSTLRLILLRPRPKKANAAKIFSAAAAKNAIRDCVIQFAQSTLDDTELAPVLMPEAREEKLLSRLLLALSVANEASLSIDNVYAAQHPALFHGLNVFQHAIMRTPSNLSSESGFLDETHRVMGRTGALLTAMREKFLQTTEGSLLTGISSTPNVSPLVFALIERSKASESGVPSHPRHAVWWYKRPFPSSRVTAVMASDWLNGAVARLIVDEAKLQSLINVTGSAVDIVSSSLQDRFRCLMAHEVDTESGSLFVLLSCFEAPSRRKHQVGSPKSIQSVSEHFASEAALVRPAIVHDPADTLANSALSTVVQVEADNLIVAEVENVRSVHSSSSIPTVAGSQIKRLASSPRVTPRFGTPPRIAIKEQSPKASPRSTGKTNDRIISPASLRMQPQQTVKPAATSLADSARSPKRQFATPQRKPLPHDVSSAIDTVRSVVQQGRTVKKERATFNASAAPSSIPRPRTSQWHESPPGTGRASLGPVNHDHVLESSATSAHYAPVATVAADSTPAKRRLDMSSTIAAPVPATSASLVPASVRTQNAVRAQQHHSGSQIPMSRAQVALVSASPANIRPPNLPISEQPTPARVRAMPLSFLKAQSEILKGGKNNVTFQ
jgi:hypothetical protein